ncbi:MAG: hypothetical protein ABFE13_22620, partial [Phycisphaerales bacterium]
DITQSRQTEYVIALCMAGLLKEYTPRKVRPVANWKNLHTMPKQRSGIEPISLYHILGPPASGITQEQAGESMPGG